MAHSEQSLHSTPTTGVDVRKDGGRTFVQLEGEIDIASAPRIAQEVASAIEGHAAEVVIDLRDVLFIDSAGLGVLVNANQRARRNEVSLKLVLPEGPARFPFEVTGLVGMFDRYDETEPQPS